MQNFVIGVDIGGSHITSAVVDFSKEKLLAHTLKRESLNSQGSLQNILTTWCKVITASAGEAGLVPRKIGIAMPGPFDYEEGVSYIRNQNKFESLYGVNVKQFLAEKLSVPSAHISFTNDAACFLQGEVAGGAAKAGLNVVGLTLGTGFGSAKCVDDVTLDANLWCSPYKDGIAEDYLSTRWFVKRYMELTGEKMSDVKAIAEKIHADEHARNVFSEFGTNLGNFLLPTMQADHIDTLIVGGNIANAFIYFKENLETVFSQHDLKVKVAQSALGENAALYGAASFCALSTLHSNG